MTLSSFGPGANVAVLGASGGIGNALCNQLLSSDTVGTLHASSRKPPTFDDERVTVSQFDVSDEQIKDIADSAARDSDLDLVLVTTGLLHRDQVQPEKSIQQLAASHLAEVYEVNTIAPLLIAKHFLPRLARDRKSVFAVLSARVGSIEDNRLGGWYAYRASKAALNMAVKTLSIEHARRASQSIVVALHPGTVATELSKPFSRQTSNRTVFSAAQSATHLLNVVDRLTPSDTGGFFAWDGQRIPW